MERWIRAPILVGLCVLTEFRRFEHADGSVSTANAELRGRVSKLGASGTVRLNNTYRRPDGRHQECESGRVAWTAH